MPKRIFLLGATGTIGRATLCALRARGHEVIFFIRSPRPDLPDARVGDVCDPISVRTEGFKDQHFDCVISCMASRSGVPQDAWAVDYAAHLNILAAAQSVGVGHFVLLSSICVQRPTLPFQQAKLAFEHALIGSGMTHSIVRPTAYFKSLSGQVDRVRKGKPFLLFGDGELTACKPVSDRDMAEFLADCVDDSALCNRILPVGGPGEPITPRQQGEMLFALMGKQPRFRHVPLWLFNVIASALRAGALVSPAAARKAELARIGRYYATESMLLLDPATGQYDAAATPSIGSDTLQEHYARLIAGETTVERGDHSVF